MSLLVHLVPTLAGTQAGSEVLVEGAEAHHAVAVRRLRVGESVALTDGAGRQAVGEVVVAERTGLRVVVRSVLEVPRPQPELVVVQALAKGDRGELAVEVLTEIGVDRILPWAAERSQVSWRGDRGVKPLARWRATAREAAKQARRSWLPEVTDPVSTDDVVRLVAEAPLAVVLHEEATRPLSGLDVPATGSVVVVVGPEGGLTDTEVTSLEAAGAVACRLGTEVLRTSTAGLAAASALLTRTPRWGG